MHLLERLKHHDYHTYIHSVSVSKTLVQFGQYLKLSSQDLTKLKRLGMLHDIGKLNIAPYIIKKSSQLTFEEWLNIKNHPLYGYDILEGEQIDLEIKKAILEHHENYDGTGYPYEVKGNNISLFGKMIRIVDSFDAMTSTRSYSNAKSYKDAKKEILQSANTLYDPFLAVLFVSMLNDSH